MTARKVSDGFHRIGPKEGTCNVCGDRVTWNSLGMAGHLKRSKKHNLPAGPVITKEPPKAEKCIHCGKDCKADEGVVCGPCYSKYTPGMLADLDQ